MSLKSVKYLYINTRKSEILTPITENVIQMRKVFPDII